MEDLVAKSVLGSRELNTYLTPSQVVNYVEAHDNYNLNDLLWELHPQDSFETRAQRVELATGMNLLMQGICFMQLGQEFMRTKLYPTGPNGQLTQEDKELAMNSYNAPDQVNQIDWNLVTRNKPMIEAVRALIHLKKAHPLLSLDTYEAIEEAVQITKAQDGQVGFFLKGEAGGLEILFNAHELTISVRDF